MSEFDNKTRRLNFSGTWYEADPELLKKEIIENLKNVTPQPTLGYTKAIIVPHAGYRYSGQTAAYSYACVDPSKVTRIILFCPLHHVNTRGLHLPSFRKYQTPFGDIDVDLSVAEKLAETRMFDLLPMDVDEKEHNLEMQLPYISHIMSGKDFKILPIFVGKIHFYDQARLSRFFYEYLSDPSTLFIISSDFCHYGPNYCFQPFEMQPNISKSIEVLDQAAIDSLENINRDEFARYLECTRTTICGRYPLLLFLTLVNFMTKSNALQYKEISGKLCYYTKSNQNVQKGDNSVSYVSMCYRINPALTEKLNKNE